MHAAGAAVLAPAARSAPSAIWPILEGPNTPKLCLHAPDTESGMRRVRQLGVNYALGGGFPLPWKEAEVREYIARYRAGGLEITRLSFPLVPDVVFARPNRDQVIDQLRQSIRAAGRAGLKLIEYNFYSHRAYEGYYEESGRAGAGYTGFDNDRMKGLPPLPEEGQHGAEELWRNAEYLLKAIIPVAEECGIRMAIHPNDPPALTSRGSAQLLPTFADWKRYLSIVDSPCNGITYDCGVSRELGEDPVEVCRYLASRDRINHVHFRNVRVRVPYEKYAEVFIDEGQVDMFGVMKELVRNKYTGTIFPEHPRALDYDREFATLSGRPQRGYPGGGGYAGYVFSTAYARAMLQAALASV